MGAMRAWSIAESRLPAALALLIWAGLLLGGAGCGWPFFNRSQGINQANDRFLSTVRPASGDTVRLLRNAHYFQLMGRPELALKELEEAHQQEPHNLKVVDALARVYEDLGDLEQAQKLYQEALAGNSSHPGLINNLCFSYYLAGKWEAAEACFREALARNPRNSAARNNLGLLWCRTGRLEEARRLWREAEGEEVARKRMSQALAALGRSEPDNYAEEPRPATPGQPDPSSQKQIPLAAGPQPRPGAGTPGLPPPVLKTQKPEAPRLPPLTAAELTDTSITVLNGAGAPNLAARTREVLSREGFQVDRIGNHRDFGAQETLISYRPEAERVAQALEAKCLQLSRMEQNTELPEGVDIKVILGHDLLQRPQWLAQLAEGDEE